MLSLKSSSNNLGFKIEEAIKIKQGKGINAFNPLTLSKERNFLKINNILYIVITNFVYRIILKMENCINLLHVLRFHV